MSYQEEGSELFNLAQDKLAEAICTILLKMKNKSERIEALEKLEKVPTENDLKRIISIALKTERYETIVAIKEYAISRKIKL